jgi:hypothetical protein
MTLRMALAAVLLSYATASAPAANVTLTRVSRPVSAAEAAAGAPLGGFVHDFFATSSTDILSVMDVAIEAPLFTSTLGVQNAAPNPALSALSPAIGAHSYIAMPGDTIVLGGGFDGPRGLPTWGDLSNDGPQDSFLFARLTVGQTGTFSGSLTVKGYDNFVALPFQFTLPGTAADLGLLAGEPAYSLDYSLDPPPVALPPTPDPPATLPPVLPPVTPPAVEPPPVTPTIPDPAAPSLDPPADPPVVNDPVDTPPSIDPPQHGEIITWIPPNHGEVYWFNYNLGGIAPYYRIDLTTGQRWLANHEGVPMEGDLFLAVDAVNSESSAQSSNSVVNFSANDGGPIVVALNGMTSSVERTAVPEPATAALLSGCLLLLAASRRRV